MNDTDHLPPERKLSPRRRDQILRSVLNGEEPNMVGRRSIRWIAPIAVAAATALIAVGAVALTGGDESSDGQQPAGEPSGDTVPLDLGPLSEAEIQEELDQSGWGSVDKFGFPYARWIDGPADRVPVLVARHDRGHRLFKAGNLVGIVDKAPKPTPAHPIRDIDPELDTNPDGGDAVYDRTDEFWKIAGFYRVADSVDRIEVRVGTPAGSEPWRMAEPHDGWVFWATWFEIAAYEPGTELTVEWRAYDTDGNRIDAELLPDQSRTVRVPEPPPPPTGAEVYTEVRDMLQGVASEHFDPVGQHLVAPPRKARTGVGSDDSGWLAVGLVDGWVNDGESGRGMVQVSLGESTPETRLDMETHTGCPADPACERRDVDGGQAWVLERDDGTISVSYVRPSGDLVWINTDLLYDNVSDTPVSSIDITVDEALDFVTDKRMEFSTD